LDLRSNSVFISHRRVSRKPWKKGFGENANGAVAYYDLEPRSYAQIRYSPATKLVFRGTDVQGDYGITPWNLRAALGKLDRNRSVGLALVEADIELLYGVQMQLREGRYLRVAELLARLGVSRAELRDAISSEFKAQTLDAKFHLGACAWKELRGEHKVMRRLLASRLAVHELFDERVEFSLLKREEQASNDLVLESDPRATQNRLTAALRVAVKKNSPSHGNLNRNHGKAMNL
jgi:hypothetical protein